MDRKRYVLNQPDSLDQRAMNQDIQEFLRYMKIDLTLSIDRKIISSLNQIDSFKKDKAEDTRIICYSTNSIHVPFGKRLPVYTKSGFQKKSNPKGTLTIREVVMCRLDDLNEQEIQKCGYESRNNLIYKMIEHTGRPYKDLKLDSWITCYTLASYVEIEKISPKSMTTLLEILQPFG